MYKYHNVKIVLCGLLLGMISFFADSALAEAWYLVNVSQIVPRASGDVVMQVTPGTTETRFKGTARVFISKDDAGANKMLATVMTAATMEKQMTVYLKDVPTWDSVGQILSISLVVQ